MILGYLAFSLSANFVFALHPSFLTAYKNRQNTLEIGEVRPEAPPGDDSPKSFLHRDSVVALTQEIPIRTSPSHSLQHRDEVAVGEVTLVQPSAPSRELREETSFMEERGDARRLQQIAHPWSANNAAMYFASRDNNDMKGWKNKNQFNFVDFRERGAEEIPTGEMVSHKLGLSMVGFIFFILLSVSILYTQPEMQEEIKNWVHVTYEKHRTSKSQPILLAPEPEDWVE